ncbi:MAG: hypothetical protein QNL62_19615 [Gammaproteobacteria bacterium]|nr:hypothetical protein [Gammaproteobacteria bacterium]
MSSQKKVIQFIKDHYDGDMDRALKVLADAAKVEPPKVTQPGQPKKEDDLKSFWYGIVYYLCHIERRYLGTSDNVVRVKTGSIKKALNAIRPMVLKVNKQCGLNVTPGHAEYNKWKKDNMHYFELNENAIAGTTLYSKDNIHFSIYITAAEYENGKYENEITFQSYPPVN